MHESPRIAVTDPPLAYRCRVAGKILQQIRSKSNDVITLSATDKRLPCGITDLCNSLTVLAPFERPCTVEGQRNTRLRIINDLKPVFDECVVGSANFQ